LGFPTIRKLCIFYKRVEFLLSDPPNTILRDFDGTRSRNYYKSHHDEDDEGLFDYFVLVGAKATEREMVPYFQFPISYSCIDIVRLD